MAQTGYSPISLYYSTTASAVPTNTNLVSGELAINITDGKLYYKDNGGTVRLLAQKGDVVTPITNNGVVYVNSSGQATSDSALTFSGTTLNFGGTGKRITGDMSSSPLANRLYFQNSNSNANTSLGVIPNGTATSSRMNLFSSSDPDNSTYMQVAIDGSTAYLNASFSGTASAPNFGILVGGSSRYNITTSGESYWSVGASEQMRLTSTGLGIGTSSPAVRLDVQGGNATINRASNATILTLGGSPSSNWEGDIQFVTSNNQINWRLSSNRVASGAFTITPSTATGGSTFTTPALLIDSAGNVGIGTSSPGQKLHVENSANSSTWTKVSNGNNGSGAAAGVLFGTDQGDAGAISQNSSNVAYGTYANALRVRNLLSAPITLETGGTVRAIIDSSGNLGLGVTPSAWGSTYKTYEVGSPGSGITVVTTNANTNIVSNAYNTGSSWFYGANGYAARYSAQASGGAHVWLTAPNNTSGAGAACTFTQAMTLDASGNLVGGGKTATSLTTAGFELTSDGALRSTKSSTSTNLATNNGGSLQLTNSSNTDNNFSNIGAYNSNGLVVSQVNFISVSQASRTGAIAFMTHNGSSLNEAARFDKDGNLLVGTTSVPNGTSVYGSAFFAASNSRRVLAIATSSTASQDLVQFFNPNGQVGQITTNGSVTTYGSLSDYRLKEQVQRMTGALAKVAALKPCTYKWKADGSEGEGFIAHELQAVVPQCVTGEKDAVDEDGKPVYQGIDTSFLVATLTAAIQEQQALITQLTERITILESK